MLRTEIRYFLFLRLTESIHIGRLLEIGGSNQDTKVWKLRKLNVIMILQIFRGINTAYSMYQITTSIGFTNFFSSESNISSFLNCGFSTMYVRILQFA